MIETRFLSLETNFTAVRYFFMLYNQRSIRIMTTFLASKEFICVSCFHFRLRQRIVLGNEIGSHVEKGGKISFFWKFVENREKNSGKKEFDNGR